MCNLQDLSDVSNKWHGIAVQCPGLVLFAALKCAFAVKDFGVFLSVHQHRDNISVATDQPPPGPPGPGGPGPGPPGGPGPKPPPLRPEPSLDNAKLVQQLEALLGIVEEDVTAAGEGLTGTARPNFSCPRHFVHVGFWLC